MKHIISLCMLCISMSLFSQDTLHKPYNNELGLDATLLLTNFLDLTYDDPYYSYAYQPQFSFFYKYYFTHSCIKLYTEGFLSHKDETNTDSTKEYNTDYTFSFRPGYAWVLPLSKRWEIQYGPDAIFILSVDKSTDDYYNAGYKHGHKDTDITFGAGPSVEIDFKISERLRLSTEGGIFYTHTASDEISTYEPRDNIYPQLPDETSGDVTQSVNFIIPFSIYFSFMF